MKVQVSIEGREEVHLEMVGEPSKTEVRLHGIGNRALLQLLRTWNPRLQGDVQTWPMPEGNTVGEILLREAILRAQGKWSPPYTEKELCHCRGISLKQVEDAIRCGAHTSEKVSRWTSASTSCGTCRPDVESLLDYFLRGRGSSGNFPCSK